MKTYKLLLLTFFTLNIFSQEKEPDGGSNNFSYSSFGLHAFNGTNSGIEAKFSLSLPGPLYLAAEAKADGVDVDTQEYDKFIKAVRIGAHVGIGDFLNSVSVGDVSLKIENFMDVFIELGIKSTSIENQLDFSESDTQANVITGLRFGDSNGWEGKIYVDFSKETEVVQQECPENLICTAFDTAQVNYLLDDETDQKFGFIATYNINKRSALVIETSTSEVIDNVFKVGYQLNF